MQREENGASEKPGASVLVIEDKEVHAVLARRLLRQAGFATTIICDSVPDGLERAKRLINKAVDPQVHLIILDWMLPIDLSPSLDGTVVAAELIRAMDEDEIHPVHVVVLTQDPTLEREQDAMNLGCSLVLPKPLSLQTAQQLRLLADTMPHYPVSPEHRAVYQRVLRLVKPTLELLYQGRPSTATFRWDRQRVREVLTTLDLVDLPALVREVVQEYGGLQKLRGYLRAVSLPDEQQSNLRNAYLDYPGKS